MSGSIVKSKGYLPFFTRGTVVKGFGRGSKELGIPTANIDESLVTHLPNQVDTGIYYGWANVNRGDIYKMVVSIGWNPYYKNEKKSMETHILHEFPEDFYGAELRTAVVGYIRQEQDYPSLDTLIKAIHSDIDFAKKELESAEALAIKDSEFFKSAKESNYVIMPESS